MSQALMESGFPFAEHPQADAIRRVIDDSLYVETAIPGGNVWDEDAELYVRPSYTYIRDWLAQAGVVLAARDESELWDFASDYASMVDQEEDWAELRKLETEGGNDD